MSATVTWNGDKFLRDLRGAVVNGLTAVQVEFQKQVGRQLNKHASNRSRGGIASPVGGSPGKATGTLARSWQVTPVIDRSNINDRVRPRLSIGSNLVYARIHEFGGTIRPKSKAALPVPIHPDAKAAAAKGLSPRQAFGDTLDYIDRSKRGKPPLLVRFKAGGRKRGDSWEIMYVLSKRVIMPARPTCAQL